jgi:hypothetical protein
VLLEVEERIADALDVAWIATAGDDVEAIAGEIGDEANFRELR